MQQIIIHFRHDFTQACELVIQANTDRPGLGSIFTANMDHPLWLA